MTAYIDKILARPSQWVLAFSVMAWIVILLSVSVGDWRPDAPFSLLLAGACLMVGASLTWVYGEAAHRRLHVEDELS